MDTGTLLLCPGMGREWRFPEAKSFLGVGVGVCKMNDAGVWGQVRVGRCGRQPLYLHNPDGLFPCPAPRWFSFLGAKAGAEQAQPCLVCTGTMQDLSLSP